MKLNKVFLTAAIALGLVACKNNDVPEPNQVSGGNTFAGMYVSAVEKGTTRAVTDKQEDYDGRADESTITSLNLLSSVQEQAWESGNQDEAGKFWETSTGSKTFTVAPWKTQSGNQAMALLLNKGALSPSIGEASNMVYGTAGEEKANIAALSTDQAFVMTSKAESKNIADGVDEAKVKAGTAESDNVFSFDVERVVAQGLVAKEATLQETTKDGKGKVDLNDLTYAGLNGGAKTYLFRNNAGERTMTDSDGLYKDFKSAIHAYTDYEAAQSASAVASNLIRLGNVSTVSNDELGNYKAINVSATADAAKTARGIYFMENSVDKTTTWTEESKNFGFYRLAYAKVYATYTPNEVFYLDNNKVMQKKAGVKGTTFYKGATDGLIYDNVESAQASLLAPNQKVYTYTNGRTAYRALWNRQGNTANGKFTLDNADVRRNNTYLITIEAFQGLGMAWDSSDPNDPNLPKPGTEEEGTTPDNPDVEKQDTYMRVEAKVLQWNLVSRKTILD